MKQMQKGFTLIELMIVVAIIGILAAVAIPAYQDYVVKAKLSKTTTVLDPIKLNLAMYYQEQGGFPVDNKTITYPGGGAVTAGDMWSSMGLAKIPTIPAELATLQVSSTDGTTVVMVATLDNIKATVIDGTTVTITGTPGSTTIEWANVCTSTETVLKKYFNC